MKRQTLLAPRIALFAALIYVLSWGTSYLPNVNFIFFIVFSAGLVWGAWAGATVGLVGMGLWTTFNPYGPATGPVVIAQVIGAAACGPVGALFARFGWATTKSNGQMARMIGAACLCTIVYYLPVNIVDAWVFGPFRERFIGGMLWAAISLGFNVIIFPLLFPAAQHLYERESSMQ